MEGGWGEPKNQQFNKEIQSWIGLIAQQQFILKGNDVLS